MIKQALPNYFVHDCRWESKSQQVKLAGALSSIMPSPLGDPQGSVISPTLFTALIDNLHLELSGYQ